MGKRTKGIFLIVVGGTGVLAVPAFLLLLAIAAYIPSGQNAPPDQAPQAQNAAPAPPATARSDKYGTIEIGSSGIKGIVWEITPDKAKELFQVRPDVQTARYAVFKHAMIKHYKDFNTKLQDERNVDAAVRAVAGLLHDMREKEHVPDEQIYVVASSGVANLPDIEIIKTKVGERTGKTPDVITAALECQYTFDWVVPPSERYDVAVVDVGSGNTKACYMEESDDFGGRSRGGELLRYGAKSFETKVNSTKAPGEEFAATSRRIAHSTIDGAVAEFVQGDPGLATRHKVYVSGGGAWVTASLLHARHKKDDLIKLSAPADFLEARQLATSGQADLRSLGDPFTDDQYIAVLDVLITLSQDLKLDKRSIVFPSAARDAWMSNYLMIKLSELPKPS